MEDEVWVSLRHRANIEDVVTHDNVRKCERGCRTERKMAHRQTHWFASMLGHDDDVSDVVGATRRHQLLDLVVATVDTLRVGKQQLDFLQHT